jgi:hypothetical protein
MNEGSGLHSFSRLPFLPLRPFQLLSLLVAVTIVRYASCILR